MSELYRKVGRSIRYENGVTVHIDEAGEAVEDGPVFRCQPIEHTVKLPALDGSALLGTAAALRELVTAPLTLERLVLSEGVAEHQFGERRWRETIRRLHLSITFRSLRALIDGGDFDLEEVRAVVESLPQAGPEREAPSSLRLAPNVTAALLPSFAASAPPGLRLVQSAGGVDGKGRDVQACPLSRPWRNWYRPSYRVRPIRAPFNLAAGPALLVDDGLPRAIAVLAPPEGLLVRVLCVDGRDVFPATVRAARIRAVGEPARWYPYGAGSFGAEMML